MTKSAITAGIIHFRHTRLVDLRFCVLRLFLFARAMVLLSYLLYSTVSPRVRLLSVYSGIPAAILQVCGLGADAEGQSCKNRVS
jgi:hypothetical protein